MTQNTHTTPLPSHQSLPSILPPSTSILGTTATSSHPRTTPDSSSHPRLSCLKGSRSAFETDTCPIGIATTNLDSLRSSSCTSPARANDPSTKSRVVTFSLDPNIDRMQDALDKVSWNVDTYLGILDEIFSAMGELVSAENLHLGHNTLTKEDTRLRINRWAGLSIHAHEALEKLYKSIYDLSSRQHDLSDSLSDSQVDSVAVPQDPLALYDPSSRLTTPDVRSAVQSIPTDRRERVLLTRTKSKIRRKLARHCRDAMGLADDINADIC